MITRNTAPIVLILLAVVGYSSFLGGVEAAYLAENETVSQERRDEILEGYDDIRVNMTAGNLSEEINKSTEVESDEEAEYPAWMDNETIDALERDSSSSGLEDSPTWLLETLARVFNAAAGIGESAAIAGFVFGQRFGVLAWSIAWVPPIVGLYSSPWIFLAWLRWNERKAIEKA